MLKSTEQNQKILNLFLDRGLNPYDVKKKRYDECYEPIFIVQDDMKLLDKLIKAGLNPNEIRCYSNTTIASATYSRNIEVFKKLLELKGDVYKGSRDALIQAMEDSNKDLLHWIVKIDLICLKMPVKRS